VVTVVSTVAKPVITVSMMTKVMMPVVPEV
jgi:hypothetical protein